MINLPIAVLTDSYKLSHPFCYPDANEMSAYGECRKSYPDVDDDRIVFYGIRYIVDNYLNKQWTVEDVEKADKFYSTHNVGFSEYPFPKDLFLKFVKENDGYFPVKIESLREGTVIHKRVPVYQITAKGDYSRLVTFLETILTNVWYGTTVATLSRLARQLVDDYFDKSVDKEFYFLRESRLHDFGFRGTTCVEQSVLGGVAHLLNFTGSDTVSASYYAQFELNNGNPVAQSIPATEHSVMTAWPTELDAVMNMVDKYGSGLFAAVADSYDYYEYLDSVLSKVAPKIIERGGTMVVRPDSGDPIECVVEGLKACAKHFGYTTNSKGYKVLNNSAVIQGDGINYFDMKDILSAAIEAGFSAQNVAFGMGAGLLQKVNRDTLSFATKLSYIEYKDGTKRDVMKIVKTDPGKASFPGKLTVKRDDGIPKVFPSGPISWGDRRGDKNLLEVVYDCGPVDVEWESFDELKSRVDNEWNAMPKHSESLSEELKAKISKITKEL